MRNIIFIAVFALVIAAIVPRFAANVSKPQSGEQNARVAVTAPPTPAPTPTAYGRTMTIRPDSRGHFQAEGRVDGQRMDFVVDTGATVVAIPEREASRLGIHPARREYTAQIRTANGTVNAAPTQLYVVEIGGLTVRDVAAVVLPDEALSENLLGMSFLSRLRRFEFANGRLELEQ